MGLGQIAMGYDLNLDPARYVYSHARAFSLHPDFHLLAAVDPDPIKRQTYVESFQCPAYADIETALGLHQPGLVVIATPTPLHKDTLEKVLGRSSPKIILCEKPLSYDSIQAKWMVNACLEVGVELYVNYIRRSDPAVEEVKVRIDTGRIEVPIKCVVWYTKGLLHNGAHFFNLLAYWLGDMCDSTIVSRGSCWGGGDPEPDFHVTFAKGEAVFLSGWETAFSHYGIELLSPSGRLRYENGGALVHWQAARADDHLIGYRELSSQVESIANGMDRYQWYVADQLANAIRQKSCNLSSGIDGLNTLIALNRVLGR